MTTRSLLLGLLVPSLIAAAAAQNAPPTIRICDDTGCSERPRNSASFDPAASSDPEGDRRLVALAAMAEQDPRAAYDLGLRHFRGDGVRQDSYQAIRWMRSAGERGDARAQLALGRFYLMGLQEMGADPIEAERWLGLAASGGDAEARELLEQARSARRDERAYHRWREAHRHAWHGWWARGYPYHWYWGPAGWYRR